ncbi:hypothetical protein FRC02_001026 [Tulasnella sp. 418]|nr:hypothetical protein FRC02_001026 [Tulasnella sp. 418]
MSRPNYETGRTSFASRTVFEALDVDDIESEPESEHEVQLPLEPPPPAPAPVTPPKEPVGLPVRSKSSLKRAAKKERAALAAMEPSASALVNGSESVNDHEVEPESTSQTDATESPSGLAPVRSAARARSPARPVDSTTPFSPSLPEDLPQPRSPGLGPRKRKASQDLKSKPLSKESKLEDASFAADGNEKVNVVQLSSLKATSGPINTGADHEKGKRFQQAVTRTIWTLIMIGGFIGLLLAGPVYMVLLVMVCQTLVYREVTALFGLTTKSSGEPPITTKGKSDPWSKTLNWYFFAVTNYFLYGESMIYYFKHVVYADVRFLPFATHHRFISFMLYIFGFMGFVASLKKQYLKQQFGLFGWVHMSLLVIIFSSHFIVNNILEASINLYGKSDFIEICGTGYDLVLGSCISGYLQ